MSYIEGLVIPVRADRKDAYRQLAETAAAIFKDHGALRVVECWGDDVPEGKVTDFWRAVKAEPGETIVFSWVVWPSRAVRDEGNRKVMADPRWPSASDMPFDGKRMILGGFEVLLDTGE